MLFVDSLCKGQSLFKQLHVRKDKFPMNRNIIIASQIAQVSVLWMTELFDFNIQMRYCILKMVLCFCRVCGVIHNELWLLFMQFPTHVTSSCQWQLCGHQLMFIRSLEPLRTVARLLLIGRLLIGRSLTIAHRTIVHKFAVHFAHTDNCLCGFLLIVSAFC